MRRNWSRAGWNFVGVMALASFAMTQGASPATAGTVLVGDPVAGKAAWTACQACHELDSNKTGPKHRGLVGRKAGAAPGFKYSVALAEAGIIWTPENLDTWLQDPGTMVMGTKMFYSVSDPKQRADIIAYLATEK